jgi:hypothetical protein
MTKMNPVHSSVRRPIDEGIERRGLSALVVATLAIALFVVGGTAFYSFSGSQPATVTANQSRVAGAFQALEAAQLAPTLTTTGQGSH